MHPAWTPTGGTCEVPAGQILIGSSWQLHPDSLHWVWLALEVSYLLELEQGQEQEQEQQQQGRGQQLRLEKIQQR